MNKTTARKLVKQTIIRL